jgi:YhcH/YjgK/YiaL family protein
MIMDRLENAHLYQGLGDHIAKGLHFLNTTDLTALEPGRHPIEDDELFVMVMDYDTKPMADAVWEGHKRYLDIQAVVGADEMMGYADISQLELGEYDDERDFQAISGQGAFMKFEPGMFAIFWPQDGHAPGVAVDDKPVKARKVVVKAKVA